MTKIMREEGGLQICVVAPTANSIIPGNEVEAVGGAEMQLIILSRAFASIGIRTTFMVGDFQQPGRLLVGDIPVWKGPFRYLGGPKRHLLSDTLKLGLLLRKLRPDVVLIKTPRMLLFPLGLVCKAQGIKLVRIVSHDSDCKLVFWPVANILYLIGTRLADDYVFQSRDQKEMAWKNLRIKGQVILNIAHEISADPREVTRDIDGLWVGTCIPRKDPHGFLDIVESLPQYKFSMVVAPGADDEFNDGVAQRARQSANLDYRGFVPYCDVSKYYQRARILVHTSRAEGFPNVFLQAWQFGIPVIARHVDPDGVVTRNELGKVSRTLERQIADVVEALLDEAKRGMWGERCRKYVDNNHAPELVVKKYELLFREIGSIG
jgi:glycosyltransferase involved in cell wall biosynthesis